MVFPWQSIYWQQVSTLIESKRLPHAMLLQGNEGLGKFEFAQALAHAVLCQQPDENHHACGKCQSCMLIAAETHPDLYLLQPTAKENSKSTKPALSIRIENIRVLCEKLNQTSQYGGYRVAILDQAEQLTTSAANSLLKTLEEPGQNVLILLVSARPQRLPITIRSRCQSMRLSVPDEGQALAWLQQAAKEKQAEVDPAQIPQALRYAHGSPLTALTYLADFEHLQVLSDAMTASIQGKNSLEYALKLAKLSKVETLEGMVGWATDLTKLQTCGPDAEIVNERYRANLQAVANKANQQRVFRFHEQLNFNLQHSAIAVNEQLLWENLLLSWDNL